MSFSYRKRYLLLVVGVLWPQAVISALSAFASFSALPSSPSSEAIRGDAPSWSKSSTGRISRGVSAARNAGIMRQGYHDAEGSITLERAGQLLEAEVSEGAGTDRLKLKGPILDLVTPFTSEGDVDFAAFGEYLQFLSQAGVQTVLCNGEAGEFESLTVEERRILVDFARTTFAGTVLNHVSASALPDVARLISHSSKKSRGGHRTIADAVVLMAPLSRSSFGGVTVATSQGGLEAFLRRALKGCELPVFLYSSPGNPISSGLYLRLCEDFPAIRGIMDGGSGGGSNSDAEKIMELKKALPEKQLLLAIGDRFPGTGREVHPPVNSFSAVETAGADAYVMRVSSPLPELVVRMQACLDRGDRSGARQAEKGLEAWAKKRQTLATMEFEISVVKAAVAARVPSFPLYTRPPLQDLNRETAETVMRWVANNEDVSREKRDAHIRRISAELSDVYRRAWKNVEIAGLELLFEQLSASEERLLDYLEKAKRQRAELTERSAKSARASEVEAARLLSDVMDARRRLEEDAAAVDNDDYRDVSVCSGLKERLEGARVIAEISEDRLGHLDDPVGTERAKEPVDSDDPPSRGEGFVDIAATLPAADGIDRFDLDPEGILSITPSRGGETMNRTANAPFNDDVSGVLNGDVISSVRGFINGGHDSDVKNDVDVDFNGSIGGFVSGSVNGDLSSDANVNDGIAVDGSVDGIVDSRSVACSGINSDVSGLGENVTPETDRPVAVTRIAPTSTAVPTPPASDNRVLFSENHGSERAAKSGAIVGLAASIDELASDDTSDVNGFGRGARGYRGTREVSGTVGDAAPAGADLTAVATREDVAARGVELVSEPAESYQHRAGGEWEGDEIFPGPAEFAPLRTSDSGADGGSSCSLARERLDCGAADETSHFGASATATASGQHDPTSSSSSRCDTLPSRAAQKFGQPPRVPHILSKWMENRKPNQAEPVSGYRSSSPPQQGGDSGETPAMAAQTMKAEVASSPGRGLESGAPKRTKAMFGAVDGGAGGSSAAKELLETKPTFSGSVGVEAPSGPGVNLGQSESEAESNNNSINRREALPTPRYGRYIPEGLPSKTPKTLPPDFPFQADRMTSAPHPATGGQSHQPRLRHEDKHNLGKGGLKGERRTAAFSAGDSEGLIGRGRRMHEPHDGRLGENPPRLWGTSQLGRNGATKKFEATVDDFIEKEKETFFKSKGIDGDVDSFDWDGLRRNTLEIESLQREAVDRYWRRQGLQGPDHRCPPRRR